jgi:hypothetical protein
MIIHSYRQRQDSLRKSRRISMKNEMIVVFVLASSWFLTAPSARAQAATSKDNQTVSEQDIQLLRQDIRSQKKQLIAANLAGVRPIQRGEDEARRSKICFDQGICA